MEFVYCKRLAICFGRFLFLRIGLNSEIGKQIVPVYRGLVYLANALDGLSSGGASLALLKMLGIPSVASFPKGQE
ncbi:MAG: hypothetical protein ABSF34_07325, partial [Verrucomicrobiota bacterium]